MTKISTQSLDKTVTTNCEIQGNNKYDQICFSGWFKHIAAKLEALDMSWNELQHGIHSFESAETKLIEMYCLQNKQSGTM